MALADILRELEADDAAEIAHIEAERDEVVAETMRDAHARATEVEAAESVSRDAALAAEADVIRNRAALHVERRLQETREAVLQDILGRAKDRLSRSRRNGGYRATMGALIDECLAFLGKAETVMIDGRDVELVTALLDERGCAAVVEPSLDCWGGLVATSGDGIFVRNTLEERLGRAESELRRRIGDLVPGLRGRGDSGTT